MSQQVLEKLFDSPVKLRLLKLFLRNPEARFTLKEIRSRTLLPPGAIGTQLKKFREIKFVILSKKGSQKFYFLNSNFIFLSELQNLILKSSPADENKMLGKIKDLGRVKLAVLSGIFVKPNREDLKTDILLVGDSVNDRKLNAFIKNLEAEAGSELYYTLLTNEEFAYRYKMFDRFVLDLLEKPHKKLINKIIR